MTDAEAYGLLQQVFNTVFGRTDLVLTPTLTARDVIGWDSLKQLDIIMDIEDRLGVEIGGEKLSGLRHVGDLAALVKAEAAAQPDRAQADRAPP